MLDVFCSCPMVRLIPWQRSDSGTIHSEKQKPQMNEVSDTLGWIFLKKNLSDSAYDTFRDLVNKTPTISTYRYHLGLALMQKGDKIKAIKELQEALKYNPSNKERDQIQQMLNKLGA